MIPFDDIEAVKLLKNRGALLSEMQALWTETMPNVPPPDRSVFVSWIFCNSVGVIVSAIGETSKKARSLEGGMTPEHATRFVQSILSNHRRKTQEQRGLPERVYASPQKEAA